MNKNHAKQKLQYTRTNKDLLSCHMKHDLSPTQQSTLHIYVSQKSLIKCNYKMTKHHSPEQVERVILNQASETGGCSWGTTSLGPHFLASSAGPSPIFHRVSEHPSWLLALCLPGKPLCPQGLSQSPLLFSLSDSVCGSLHKLQAVCRVGGGN